MAYRDPLSEKPRKSRERKGDKWLLRQQPEGKKKHRDGQRRANHEQRHELSKPSPTHDTQRHLCLTPMHSTASAVIARWAQPTSVYDNGNSSPLPDERMLVRGSHPLFPPEPLRQALQSLHWFRQDIGGRKARRETYEPPDEDG
jgi:hypothetical protein